MINRQPGRHLAFAALLAFTERSVSGTGAAVEILASNRAVAFSINRNSRPILILSLTSPADSYEAARSTRRSTASAAMAMIARSAADQLKVRPAWAALAASSASSSSISR
jgi:hypothetical protein